MRTIFTFTSYRFGNFWLSHGDHKIQRNDSLGKECMSEKFNVEKKIKGRRKFDHKFTTKQKWLCQIREL